MLTRNMTGRRALPSLAGLRAFEAAARLRSFRRAADELCVTESSISHQVRGLERQLGVKLFERLHRRVVLSTEGIEYMLVVSKAFEDIERVSVAISQHPRDRSERRRLVVASEPGFAQYWLLPRLEDWARFRPDIDIEIAPTIEVGRELSDRARVGIHYGLRISGAFHCEEIARTRVFPVASPKLKPTAATLADHVLFHERTLRMWGEWLEVAAIDDVDWRKGPVFQSTALCIDAVLSGRGLCLANELIAGDLLAQKRLVMPFEEIIDPPGYRWYIVTDAATRETEMTDAFRTWLLARLGDRNELIAA